MTAQNRPHTHQQLHVGERLHDIIVSTHRKSHDLIGFTGIGREENDGRIIPLPNLGGGHDTGKPRHIHIEDVQVNVRRTLIHYALTVLCSLYRIALSCQQKRNNVTDFLFVICNRNEFLPSLMAASKRLMPLFYHNHVPVSIPSRQRCRLRALRKQLRSSSA